MPETRGSVLLQENGGLSRESNSGMITYNRVLNLPCNVESFSGDLLKTPVRRWLDQLKTYFHNENIRDFETQFSEAKRFTIDEARYVIEGNRDIKRVKSFKEFEEVWMDIFGDESRADPCASMLEFVNHKWNPKRESFAKFKAEITNLADQMVQAAKREYEIEVPAEVTAFLEICVIYKNIPTEAARKLGKTYKKDASITKTMAKLRKRFPELEHQSERVRTIQTREEKEKEPQRSKEKWTNKKNWETRHDTSRKSEENKEKKVVCYRCTEIGHWANTCRNRPYCNYCNISGHAYRECRKRKGLSHLRNDASARTPISGRKDDKDKRVNKKEQVKAVNVVESADNASEGYFVEEIDSSDEE